MVVYSKDFKKQYQKIVQSQPNRRNKIEERIALFIEDRSNPLLRDHELGGELEGKRSFSVAGDLRIIYTIEEDKEIYFYFIAIGSHNQVY